MIFSKDIEKCCAYCTFSTKITSKEQVLCPKKGIVSTEYCCRKFEYTPLKRSPSPQILKKDEFSQEDFIIE